MVRITGLGTGLVCNTGNSLTPLLSHSSYFMDIYEISQKANEQL